MGRSRWDLKDDQYFWDRPRFGIAAVRGLIPNVEADHKFGHSHTVGTSLTTVWTYGGLYEYATASVLTISSTNAGDTAAGAGARTVQIYGLTTDYAPATTTLNMAGATTGAVTTTVFQRVYRAIVRAVGSSGENLGTIYVGSGAVSSGEPANVWAEIEPGLGQTQMAMVTVPDGYNAYIEDVYAYIAASKSVDALLMVRPENEGWQVKWNVDSFQGGEHHRFTYPLVVPAKADIEMRAEASTSNTKVSAGFGYLLVKTT